MPVLTTIKLRRGATGDWTGKSLAEGEIAIDTTTGKLKIGGTGGTTWAASTNIAVIQSDYATNVSGGLAGGIPYQSGVSTTTFLPISGSINKFVISDGSVPTWTVPTLSSTYFATTSSLLLQGVVTDGTGLSSSAKLVFNDSPDLTTPKISSGGAVFKQASGTNTTTVTSQVTSGNISLNLPSAAGTLALTTVTNGFLKADGTVDGSANAYMTGTLQVGSAPGMTVTTSGNTLIAGTVTLTHSSLKSTGNAVIKVDPSTGVVSAGKVALGDSANVTGQVLPANGGLGVDVGTVVVPPVGTSGASPLAQGRSTLRMFVQQYSPQGTNSAGNGYILNYTPAVGDLWFW